MEFANEGTTLISRETRITANPACARPYSSVRLLVAGTIVIGGLLAVFLQLQHNDVDAATSTFAPEAKIQVQTVDYNRLLFPSDFVWGVATSAYQIEGGVHEGGRGDTIWDSFVRRPGTILDNSTGNVADDHYHRWKEDIQLMKELGVTAYRFSIAWSRILPSSTGEPNQQGIAFYADIIDELRANDIEPWVTLFHWDLPQYLQDDYGGFLGLETVEAFVEYARIVFDSFSSKVNRFITLNEPWTFSVNGHVSIWRKEQGAELALTKECYHYASEYGSARAGKN